eukprot:NODE_18349_length_897_cov_2.957143.p1 GENE.NODE_18349_length_897_cov_2.957143~~NODE_18349_length_897_cov_2.957143.p1  ORF type:complete len:187 (-),score=19.95 NODE_18349_length_897_cov_2.957143:335-835(-)
MTSVREPRSESPRSAQAFRRAARNGVWKFCPRCSAIIQKDGGCDHMVCRCGCPFRWDSATLVEPCFYSFYSVWFQRMKDTTKFAAFTLGSALMVPAVAGIMTMASFALLGVLAVALAALLCHRLARLAIRAVFAGGTHAASLRTRLCPHCCRRRLWTRSDSRQKQP